MLPIREAPTLAAWLRAHPGVELISRDRSGPCAEDARQAAPQARQIAGRFHLLLNLSEALESFILHKRAAIKEAVHDPTAPVPAQTAPAQLWHDGKTERWEATSLRRHQAMVE